MKRLRLVIGVAALFCATGASTVAAAPRHPHQAPQPIFRSVRHLMPGQMTTAHITIPAAPVDAQPFIQLLDSGQHCGLSPCTTHPPALANILTLTVTDDANESWKGTLADADRRILLPGGVLSPGHSRHYELTLGLPVQADDRYEGLSIIALLQWGGVDGHGRIVTAPRRGQINPPVVKSKSVTRTSPQGGPLAFTGFDAARLLVVGLASIGAGAVMVSTARRRREHRS
jgi:hypothetical protein